MGEIYEAHVIMKLMGKTILSANYSIAFEKGIK